MSHFPSNRLPFDPTTVGGYACIFICEETFGFMYIIVAATIAEIYLSMALYLGAFYSHFMSMFQSMNELVDVKTPEASRENQMKACLIEAIKFHNEAEA